MSELHALLIGIDFYFPNQLPEGRYECLLGCVADVDAVETLLRGRLELHPQRLHRLTASVLEGATRPTEDPSSWPTYENLVGAFDRVTESAQSGDLVYVHYSGHGGRVPTWFPQLKGEAGWDETLVPTDVGDPASRHLRDLELAVLLERMVGKGLVVTVALDSCHAGGATRALGRVRGIATPDITPRRADSLVAAHEELSSAWRPPPLSRDVALVSGWLPEPEGYVLLAACRPSELANEDTIGGRACGAMTRSLVPALEQATESTTWREIHQRVVTAVHARWPLQTPMIEGEADRVVFGSHSLTTAPSIAVLEVRGVEIVLAAGQAHGVAPGATFAVTNPKGDETETPALVEVVAVAGTTSVAHNVREGSTAIDSGSRAMLVSMPPLVPQTVEIVMSDTPDVAASATVRAVMEALDNDATGFVTRVDRPDAADWRVLVGAEDYSVLDQSGAAIAPFPGVPAAPPAAFAAGLVSAFVHVGRFRSIALLERADPRSGIAGRLGLAALGTQTDYQSGELPRPTPASHSPVQVIEDEWLHLSIRNGTSREINVCLFDLRPSWEVQQVFPSEGGGDWWAIGAGEEHTLSLRASIGEKLNGYPARDLLKVFGTFEPTSFRWLQLPPMAARSGARSIAEAPRTPLQTLFAALGSGTATRDLSVAAASADDWAAASLEIQVMRRPENA